ncbi:MAG: hypothetical protein LBU91_09420 [Bacteroidales bacterium]|jgi:hypothetical protein|nr:hypothetical protein [Bacteroidales bacterium]
MNLIFNINRFAKVFQMESRMFLKVYLILFGITLLDLIISMGTHSISVGAITKAASQTDNMQLAETAHEFMGGVMPFRPGGAFGVMLFIVPFILYKFLYHPTQGLTYAMLPASQFEKFLSAFVQCVIVAPLVIFGFSLLVSLVGDLAGVPMNWDVLNFKYVLTKYYLPMICIQSVAFWGVFWFKQRKIAKTILTVIAVIVAVGIISYFDRSLYMHIYNFCFETNAYLYAITMALWALAFIKFPRTQI